MSVPFDTPPKGDRRTGVEPVPPDYESMLNSEQKNALRNVERFGWELAFVRHPLFQDPLFIVFSPDHQQYAVLEDDGGINRHSGIVIRD